VNESLMYRNSLELWEGEGFSMELRGKQLRFMNGIGWRLHGRKMLESRKMETGFIGSMKSIGVAPEQSGDAD
jgi:hypothetical protein